MNQRGRSLSDERRNGNHGDSSVPGRWRGPRRCRARVARPGVARAVDAKPLRAAGPRPVGREGVRPVPAEDRPVVAARRGQAPHPRSTLPGVRLPSRRDEQSELRGALESAGAGAGPRRALDRLATIPDEEIDAVQRIVGARVPTLPYPYLREGQRVRITRGPLADVEGILVRTKPNRGLLVVSVDLLRQSVAAHVDCTWVVPA